MFLITAAKAVVMVGLVGRLISLQINQATKYKSLSDKNRFREWKLAPERGAIKDFFDTKIASSEPLYQLHLVPENAKDLDNLFNLFDDKKNRIATLYSKIRNQEIFKDKNIVKVEINNGFASKFMRMCLGGNNIYIHQGVYAFNFKTLKQFINLKPSKNEIKFKLEQLRALENGISIRAIESVSEFHIGVDTQEDLKKANEFAKKNYSK